MLSSMFSQVDFTYEVVNRLHCLSQAFSSGVTVGSSFFLSEAATNNSEQNMSSFIRLVNDGDVNADRNGARLPA